MLSWPICWFPLNSHFDSHHVTNTDKQVLYYFTAFVVFWEILKIKQFSVYLVLIVSPVLGKGNYQSGMGIFWELYEARRESPENLVCPLGASFIGTWVCPLGPGLIGYVSRFNFCLCTQLYFMFTQVFHLSTWPSSPISLPIVNTDLTIESYLQFNANLRPFLK